MTDADAQPRKVRRAKLFDDVRKSIVAAATATDLEPHGSRRQVEFVVRDKDLACGDLVEMAEALHRLATVVHELHRRKQPDGMASDGDLRSIAAEARLVLELLT